MSTTANPTTDPLAELRTLVLTMVAPLYKSDDPIAYADAINLLTRAIRATGCLPTVGEILTWVGRRTARLLDLQQEMDKASEALIDQLNYRWVHDFWTDTRRALATGTTAEGLQEILDLPVERYREHPRQRPTEQVEHIIDVLESYGAQGLHDEWRAIGRSGLEGFDTQQVAACLELARAGELERIDEDRLVLDINEAFLVRHLRYGYREFFRNDGCARMELLRLLGLERTGEQARSEPISVSDLASGDNYGWHASEAAFELLRAHPDAILETGTEYDVRVNQLPHFRNQLGSKDPNADVILLARNSLGGLTHPNPFVGEPLLRFLEILGLDPRRDADFVTDKRYVGWGGDSYEGSWHIHAVPGEPYTLAVGVHIHGTTFIRIDKGDLAMAKARIAQDSHPVHVPGRSGADNRRLHHELDPAPNLIANVFEEYGNLFDARKIPEHYALRTSVRARLQQL